MKNYDGLKAAALAANDGYTRWHSTNESHLNFGFCHVGAAHIAAASPDVVLALIAERDALAGGVELAVKQAETLVKQRDALAAQVKQMEAQEPVAWLAFADSNGPVPLELYGLDEKACKHAVLTYARAGNWKGTVEGYLMQQGWALKPVYLAPGANPDKKDAGHLNNLRNAVNMLQAVVNGQASMTLGQAAVNAFNEYLDVAIEGAKK